MPADQQAAHTHQDLIRSNTTTMVIESQLRLRVSHERKRQEGHPSSSAPAHAHLVGRVGSKRRHTAPAVHARPTARWARLETEVGGRDAADVAVLLLRVLFAHGLQAVGRRLVVQLVDVAHARLQVGLLVRRVLLEVGSPGRLPPGLECEVDGGGADVVEGRYLSIL